MSNFKKVQKMNRVFGKTPVRDLTDPNLVAQLKLIREEYEEVMDACQHGYLPEIRKELADLLVVVYGMVDLLGFDADEDFDVVNSSNMAKSCLLREEIADTARLYAEKGISVRAECHDGEHTVFYSLFDQTDKNGKLYPANKVLKPAHYHKVTL